MEDVKMRRQFFDNLGKNYPAVEGVSITPDVIHDVNCFWVTPAEAVANKLLIYVHGGAFAVGSIHSHGPMLSHFATHFKRKILFVDYALAPENPYPAGVNDLLAVYSSFSDIDIELMGDSAGGGLIVTAMASMTTLPKAVVLFSPWLRLENDLPSHALNAGKDIIGTEYLHGAAKEYTGVSPDSLRFEHFPPALILAGEQEILLDDSRRFHARHPHTTLSIYAGKQHVWTLANIADNTATLDEIATFLTAGY